MTKTLDEIQAGDEVVLKINSHSSSSVRLARVVRTTKTQIMVIRDDLLRPYEMKFHRKGGREVGSREVGYFGSDRMLMPITDELIARIEKQKAADHLRSMREQLKAMVSRELTIEQVSAAITAIESLTKPEDGVS